MIYFIVPYYFIIILFIYYIMQYIYYIEYLLYEYFFTILNFAQDVPLFFSFAKKKHFTSQCAHPNADATK